MKISYTRPLLGLNLPGTIWIAAETDIGAYQALRAALAVITGRWRQPVSKVESLALWRRAITHPDDCPGVCAIWQATDGHVLITVRPEIHHAMGRFMLGVLAAQRVARRSCR